MLTSKPVQTQDSLAAVQYAGLVPPGAQAMAMVVSNRAVSKYGPKPGDRSEPRYNK